MEAGNGRERRVCMGRKDRACLPHFSHLSPLLWGNRRRREGEVGEKEWDIPPPFLTPLPSVQNVRVLQNMGTLEEIKDIGLSFSVHFVNSDLCNYDVFPPLTNPYIFRHRID